MFGRNSTVEPLLHSGQGVRRCLELGDFPVLGVFLIVGSKDANPDHRLVTIDTHAKREPLSYHSARGDRLYGVCEMHRTSFQKKVRVAASRITKLV